jgi:hypothetical protein
LRAFATIGDDPESIAAALPVRADRVEYLRSVRSVNCRRLLLLRAWQKMPGLRIAGSGA